MFKPSLDGDNQYRLLLSGEVFILFNKHRTLIILLVIWAVLTAWNWRIRTDKESNYVVSAFSGAITNGCKGSVSAYGRYPLGRISDGTKMIILSDIAKAIGINRYTCDDYIDEEGAAVKALSQIGSNGEVIIKFIDKDEEQSYIYTQINLLSGVDSIFTYEKIVKEAYNALEIDTNVNVNLNGRIMGHMDNDVCGEYARLVMEKAGAEFVTDAWLDDAYTAYGYDKNHKDYVNISGRHVNVNITISYDEDMDESVIHLATPIMMMDF